MAIYDDTTPLPTVPEMMRRLYKMEVENGELKALLSAANGALAKDTCGMCNWLERGDCHEAKQTLRDDVVVRNRILQAIVELEDSGLMEESRLRQCTNKARDLLDLW